MDEMLNADGLLQRLWTKAVGTDHYCKDEWKAMQRLIYALDEREKILATLEYLLSSSADLHQAIPHELLGQILRRRTIDPNADGRLPDHAKSYGVEQHG